IVMPIQINGKLRSKIEVPIDISEQKLREFVLDDDKVKSWIQGQVVRNFIVVPKKLVNIVI
ncbi:MAG: hypothetical protein PHW54_06165, partial [Candidatus Omnitrophica bacterium]|nr:hypothetical protein [Candidatus Omnitrophota bacterium]